MLILTVHLLPSLSKMPIMIIAICVETLMIMAVWMMAEWPKLFRKHIKKAKPGNNIIWMCVVTNEDFNDSLALIITS